MFTIAWNNHKGVAGFVVRDHFGKALLIATCRLVCQSAKMAEIETFC